MADSLNSLASVLEARAGERPSAVVGFDGFIDEMISVVGERRSASDFTALAGIADLGAWVTAAAGRSSLREIVVHRQDAGGCAINLGDGLASLGVAVDCFATLGAPVHPSFAAATAGFRTVESWGAAYGRTLAFEFGDGKLMFSAVAQLAEFDPALAARCAAAGAFLPRCREAGLIALTNWTLYPHMTAVWRWLQQEGWRGVAQRPRLFLDLVDPASRSREDLRDALAVARGFAATGPVSLGVNLNEANQIARLLGAAEGRDEGPALAALAAALRSALGFDEVVIHAVRAAAAADGAGAVSAPGPVCAAPRKLTGAGDRFNAGYGLGHLLALPAADRLLLGNATSGFFVRQARSPSRAELAGFLKDWAKSAPP